MHSKTKGNIGELVAAAFFAEHGFSVFSELGDNSPIDLIIHHKEDRRLFKIQCKAAIPPVGKGKIDLATSKSGPNNYKCAYVEEDIDFFTLYDMTNHKLYIIDSATALQNGKSLSLRFELPKNGQKRRINLADDFLAETVILNMRR